MTFDSRDSALWLLTLDSRLLMGDQVWYYARGDVEKGPVTGPQIKALAAAGKIRQDDFVWKEGMDGWVPAGDLHELFPGDRTSDSAQDSDVLKPTKKRPASKVKPALTVRRPTDTKRLVRPIGHMSLVVGMLMVLVARGCDTLSARHADRLAAIVTSSVDGFHQDCQSRRVSLEQQRLAIQEKANSATADQQQLNKVLSQLQQLEDSIAGEQQELEKGLWQQLRSTARQARTDHLLLGFWRESAFVLGTIVLAVGLLAVAFSGDAPERWLCLGMLGAIVFSIYVGESVFKP